MAFALMPSFESAKGLFMVPRHNLNIGGFQLDVDIVSSGILMTPFEFYKSLMEKVDHKVADEGESTIYIQNIDSDEAGALRETLKRIKCVKNYLPLLNKVFIEFESVRDADRIGVCGITVDLDQDTEGVDVLKSGPLLHPSRLPEKTPQLAPQGPAPRHLHVPAPKEQNASATQTPQTSSQKPAVMGGNEKTEQTAVKTLSAPYTSGLEKQPDAPGKSQSEVVLQDTIGASGRRNETAPGTKEPAEPVKAEPEEVKVQSKEVKETKSVELVKREAPEDVEVKGSAAVCEGLTPTTPPEPPTGPPQRPQTTLKPQQTSVKASSEAQKPVEPNPESTTQKLDTTTAASREQQQKTGNSDLVEAGINPTSKAVKVSAVAPEKTSSAQTESKQQSAAAGSQKQINPTTSSAPDLHLTPGEKLKEYQALDKLRCTSLKYPTIFSEHVSSIHICLAITNLSKFNNGCYTEADIIKLLQKYEIPCEENKLFVLPRIHMAFVLFPDVSKVQTLFKVSEQVKAKSVVLKGSELSVFAFSLPYKSFLSFYGFLKRLATFKKRKGPRDKTSIVYVWNISQSEAAHLRQALRKIGGVMNYQPMLNKVLVEFLTSLDADRFGIWCSFLKPCFSYSVFRMGVPCPNTPNVLPSLSVLALSDRDVTVAGASSPSSPMGIPVGTGTTFWVTMTTNPYVYPTGLPLFNIPAFRTVTPLSQIKHLEPVRLNRLKVIMLTGLPPNIYTQEDFAKLVWKHFPEENLDPLDNNVMFLPLQRRAFVYFSEWEACFSFLESYIRNPFYKRNYKLCVHYVLDNIFVNTNEETVYRVLMKWSNSYVSDVKSLGERLLCVEVSGRGIPFVCTVMKRVASIATFVSFLPLANRIYIEMAESSGVTKVVETLSVSKSSEQCETWKQVGRVESLKSRKLRLQDSKRIAVNLELSNVGVHSESTADEEAPKTGCDHAELGSLVLDPAAATGLSSTAMEEERRETEVPVCSITDLGTAEEKKEESVTNSSPSPTSLAQPQADLPPIDSSSFRALKEVIHQYKLHHSKQVQGATKDVRSSEVCDKTDLNFENFITIDEINEDEVDKDVSPSSKPTSRDSEEASKPTSSSPSSTDASPSSTGIQKHPLEPNKSQTNPSSSANKTSPFVPSSKSVEPSVSPGLKAQPIRAKTPKRASQALPTGRVTRSSAAAVKTSVETPRPHQKEGEPPGGAMAEASAESSTETSEIRPPSPRDKLETVLKDVKTRKEKDEGKSTEVTEKSEEDDLVMSSLDEQMNEESNEETQKPRSEGDQVSQNECLHVSEVNKDQICSEIKNAKHESATAQQEEGSPPKPDQAMEENQNVPVNQDESQTEHGEKVKDKKTNEGTKMVSEDLFQEESVPKMSARRSSRGTKGLKTSPDKVTIVTRSTRGRRTMTAEESEDGEKNGKEKETPARPGRTLGRNEQQLNNEDTPKVEDITPTNKTNTDGPKTSLEVSGESEEETKQAASPRKRGRPRKTTTVASPVLNKKIAELVEPEAKRSRSQSPRVSADFKLPPFSPDKPLGTEFVSRKWGYFCNLCSVSYMSEGATGDQHCRSQTHAENLQRYQQALERKSRISTRKTF
uniref:Matrin-type domain-containing protein n=2 Tax=Nothobranchius kuhntae TaxID=321403 RepID=A0A1A8IQC4_NOTKU